MRKKKIVSSMRLARMAVMLILALLAVQTAQADTWDGITRTNPTSYGKMIDTPLGGEWIVIRSAAELAYILDHWDEKSTSYASDYNKEFYKWNYELSTDIDMGDWSWTPLGSEPFEGSFDGGGHTIRINISGATDNYQGLFARIAEGGKVHNLHVSGNINCSNSRLVGGIAGENNGTISNCWVSADVRSDWSNSWSVLGAKVGGIAGENNGTVEYCCMTGNVTNNDAGVGGLVGDNSDGTINHSTFYGSLSSTHTQYNAFVGTHGTENSCHDVFNQGEYDNASDKTMYRNTILRPYAINISISGNGTYVAKIGETTVTGACPDQTITLTKTSGTVYGVTIKDADGNNIAYTGDDINQPLTITMPRRDVNVTVIFYTTNWDSDELGTEANPYIIDKELEWNSFAEKVNGGKNFSGKYVKLTANITVNNMAGGMDGNYRRSFNGHFDGGGNTINCQISADERDVAPFCYTENATFKDLTLTGSVTITGDSYEALGGIVAYATGTTTFTNCKVSTTLTASNVNYAGGFVGEAKYANFENCTFDGQLLGSNANYCGGFEGFANSPTTLNNCLFKPSELTITANDRSTFVHDGDATFTNCYYTQAFGTVQGLRVITTEPTHGFYAPIAFYDSNTYYLVIGTEGESGGAKTYQITEDTDINSRFIVKGTVALTLGEGKTLHAIKGIELSADNSADLTINGPGTLTIDGCIEDKSGIGAVSVGTLTINSGTINVHGGPSGAGIGGDYDNTGGGNITINGGVVNAWGGYCAAGIGGGDGRPFGYTTCGNIVINGGQVTAIGSYSYGIGPGFKRTNQYHNGSLRLNLTNPDDFVFISKEDANEDKSLQSITIADGITLYDENGVAHTSGNVGDIYGKTLRPYDYRIVLSDNDDNSTAIAAAAENGKVYNVTLSDRTLYKDGMWNTLCLPFDVVDGDPDDGLTFTGTPLEGATVVTIANATIQSKQLHLDYTAPQQTMDAGKPYLVKWETPGDNIVNPVFTGVTIKDDLSHVNAGAVRFMGIFAPEVLPAGSKDILYVGADGKLYYPSVDLTLGAFRGYFEVMFGGEDDPSGIIGINGNGAAVGDYYDLQGRKVQQPKKGLYIVNGKKVVVK